MTRLWVTAHASVAAAIVVAPASGWLGDTPSQLAYGTYMISPILFACFLWGIGYIGYQWKDSKRPAIRTIWIVALVVVGSGVYLRALSDAEQLRYENCWAIEAERVWQCAPGDDQRPNEWAPSEESDGRRCYRVSTSRTGTSIWRCD